MCGWKVDAAVAGVCFVRSSFKFAVECGLKSWHSGREFWLTGHKSKYGSETFETTTKGTSQSFPPSQHRAGHGASFHPSTGELVAGLHAVGGISIFQRGRHVAEPLTTRLRSTHIEVDNDGFCSTTAATWLATSSSTGPTARLVI